MEPVLQPIRVIDFSWVMAGPMATKMLGALGAEIIKVESADRREYADRGGWFGAVNNNKRSCAINITTAQGQDLVRQLTRISDVVVENFSSRVLGKFGLAYEDLREIRPDLIFVSASGVGRTGPQKDALAYGSLLQGYSGRASMIAPPNPRMQAMGILPAWTDPVTGLWETMAILSALYHRANTGEGAYIDLSMLESTVALLPDALLRHALGAGGSPPGGNRESDVAPGGCFPCAGHDQWLVLAVRTDAEWLALCRAMDRSDLAENPSYGDGVRRLANKEALNAEVAQWLRERPAAVAETLLQAHHVAAGRSRHMADLVEEEMDSPAPLFPELPDGSRTVALPWVVAEGGRGRSLTPPRLGADNEYVFSHLLGISQAEISRLAEAGVIR